MRSLSTTLLTLSILVISLSLWAQETARPNGTDVLVRLSYDSGFVPHGDVRQICVEVSRDREYRIVRLGNNGQPLRVHGKMEKEQFDQLTTLLGSDKFRALSGNHGGLIRQDAETFAAEIPFGIRLREDGTRQAEAWRLQWLNADGENPFPDSVARIVDWLAHFQPKNGREFERVEFPDVCPSVGLHTVQPTVADNQRP